MTPQLVITYINGREMEDIYFKKYVKKWQIIQKKERYINFHIAHFYVLFSMDPTVTQYEAGQKSHGSRVYNLRNLPKLFLTPLAYYIYMCVCVYVCILVHTLLLTYILTDMYIYMSLHFKWTYGLLFVVVRLCFCKQIWSNYLGFAYIAILAKSLYRCE